MNILIATDSFKDALPAFEVCDSLASGIESTFPEAHCRVFPLADGGEGTLAILADVLGGEWVTVRCHDPLMRAIEASYLWVASQQLAIVEMARASGLELLKVDERDCLQTTTFGTGELIADALDKGAKKIVLTAGGSATNDVGLGMALALGYTFYGKNGQSIIPKGQNLVEITSVGTASVHPNLQSVDFWVATDVKNPLYGINGAAYVYAPQKGADASAVALLDQGLASVAKLMANTFYKDVRDIEGSGAGGGIGAGAICFLNAQICSAATWIFDTLQLDEAIQQTDLIITGEGRIDSQSWQGKVLSVVWQKAQYWQKPMILVAGTLQDLDTIIQLPSVIYATSILDKPVLLSEALASTAALLYNKGQSLGKWLRYFHK
jgi:glycerate kinase